MMEILQYILTSLISILTTGGIGSFLYIKQSKKLKDLEVKAAESALKTEEITNLSASNEEWIKLYHESQVKYCELQLKFDELVNKLEEVHDGKRDLWEKYSNSQMDVAKRDLIINELNWYRCEVNACPYRKPPRIYGQQDLPQDAVDPSENPGTDCL